MTRTILVAAFAALAIAGLSTSLHAGDDHQHSSGHAHHKSDQHNAEHGAKHGGQFVETKDHHGIEMVHSGTSLIFHMTEEHEPLEVTGSSFKAIVQTGSGTRTIELKAEGTTLTAVLDAPLPAGAKIAVSGKDPHGEVLQARFVIE